MAKSQHELPRAVEPLLSWLPADTETVLVAQGPFAISPAPELETPFVLEERLRLLTMGLIFDLEEGFLRQRLRGTQLIVAVEGSRRFRGPKQLGLMPYDGCQIFRFADGSETKLQETFKDLLKRAKSRDQILGHEVAVFSELGEQDLWTYLVASPLPNVILCATDKAYLRDVLTRLGSQVEKRAFPKTLLEWDAVNVQASFWAIRHYRKETAPTDPSSPLRGRAAYNEPDPKAIGFVFDFDPKSNIARARYLSDSPSALEIVQEGWAPLNDLKPNIQTIKAGMVEVSLHIRNEEETGLFLLILIGYLGHGVYL